MVSGAIKWTHDDTYDLVLAVEYPYFLFLFFGLYIESASEQASVSFITSGNMTIRDLFCFLGVWVRGCAFWLAQRSTTEGWQAPRSRPFFCRGRHDLHWLTIQTSPKHSKGGAGSPLPTAALAA